MIIAISAFACSENRGSEHELGWKCVKECSAKANQVHLFTPAYVNPGIQEQLQKYGLTNVTVHLVDFSRSIYSLLEFIPFLGFQATAYAWEFRLFGSMLRRFRRNHFDLAIKSTYGSYRWPSFLWYFSKELYLDPLTGGGRFPLRFHAFFSPKAKCKELFRMFMQRVAFIDPFVLMTLLNASKLYTGNASTKSILPKFARKKCIVKKDFLQVDAKDFKMAEARNSVSLDPKVLKIFYTGKLLEWKGVMLILRALALLPREVNYTFTLMGAGPARELYENFVEKMGLNVVFVDPKTVPRCDLSYFFFAHDLFVFPTLHGESGYAPMEAKLHGMRLLTLDFSGLDDALTEGDIRIVTEGKGPDLVVQAIADAIEKLYHAIKS
jgi:glycosyltransferase involved in cell wall biosynthesis